MGGIVNNLGKGGLMTFENLGIFGSGVSGSWVFMICERGEGAGHKK